MVFLFNSYADEMLTNSLNNNNNNNNKYPKKHVMNN
jgi:hypothetical protein